MLLYFGTFLELFLKDGHIFGKMDTFSERWTHFRKDGHKTERWTHFRKDGHKTERLDIFEKRHFLKIDIFEKKTFLKKGHFLKIDNNFVQYNILVGVIL